jgi:hypothetical protein
MQPIVRCFGAIFCILASAVGSAWAFDPALPYGINVHLPSSALLERVAEAGIAWIRVDFNWVTMEPTRGVYDWALTDAVVNGARPQYLCHAGLYTRLGEWRAGPQHAAGGFP